MFEMFICSWCCPEYWAQLWLVSNEYRDINCANIYSHSFESIRHLLHSWRRYVHCSRPHLPLCIWWTLCRRMHFADRSMDSPKIPSAHARSTTQSIIRPLHNPIMVNSLTAFPTGTTSDMTCGHTHAHRAMKIQTIFFLHRDLSCGEVMGIFKYILIASSIFNFTGFLLCCILLILLCVRHKRVKRVPYCTATSRNRL